MFLTGNVQDTLGRRNASPETAVNLETPGSCSSLD